MSEKVIIIGSGPAGLTAAIYAARAKLEPVLFEGFSSGGSAGGQLMTTGVVENFPGFPKGIDGQELMANMREQAVRFGTKMVLDDVKEIKQDKSFSVASVGKEEYKTEAIIIATGAVARRLPMESEKKYWGKGISACAVCDGGLPMFRNKELAVIGGGDSAIEEAIHLTQFGSKVYLIHRRDQLRASKTMQERAINHPKLEILWNKVVEEFTGGDFLTGLKLKDTKTNTVTDINVSGAFEAIGHTPNTSFLNGLLETTDDGYIVTKAGSTDTSVEGIFAAGDVQDSKYRQAVSAAGSGCMAAIDTERWLQENNLV